MKKINIAIDGPAGAGKSTIAKLVAKKLNYTYIDTGAMYRALTYLAIKKNINFDNKESVEKLLQNNFSFRFIGDKVMLNGEDVTKALREKEVNENISLIVTNEKIRKIMVDKQKELAIYKGVVMDGRDIGSVVLKDAELKIYLTASKEARAKRRQLENLEKGIKTTYKEVLKNIERRDYVDIYLSKALVKTKDAIEIDTTNLEIEEVVEKILKLVEVKVMMK